MARKFDKTRHITDETFRSPISSLTPKSQRSLILIGQAYNIDWDDEVSIIPVVSPYSTEIARRSDVGHPQLSEEWIQEEIAKREAWDKLYHEKPETIQMYKEFGWHTEDGVFNQESYDKARRRILAGERAAIRRRAKPSIAGYAEAKFMVEGVGPDGEEVIFFKTAGSTKIYINGEEFKITSLLKGSASTDTDDWE